MTPDVLDLRLAPAALAVWAAAAVGLGWSAGRSIAGAALLVGSATLMVALAAAAAVTTATTPTTTTGTVVIGGTGGSRAGSARRS